MPQVIEISDGICVYLAPIEAGEGRREAERAAVAQLAVAAMRYPCAISHRADGSPYIEGADAEISVSHSRRCAALAMSRRGRIGVDIEDICRAGQLRRVAPRVLTEAEMAVYGCDDEGLLRAWTLKEAAYKAVAGAPADMRDIALPHGTDTQLIYIQTRPGTAAAEILRCAEVPGCGWMSVVRAVIP